MDDPLRNNQICVEVPSYWYLKFCTCIIQYVNPVYNLTYNENMNSGYPSQDNGGVFEIYWILLFSVMLAVFFSVYKYYIAENYMYLVESSCDPASHICFVRDCEAEECPPNELSLYALFTIPASTFPFCSDNTCTNICALGNARCNEIICSPDEGDVCVGTL